MILKTTLQNEYELLDSGAGEKLERYGLYTMIRPDPEALWVKSNEHEWQNANLEFIRNGAKSTWKIKKEVPKSWNISFGDLVFSIKPTSFKHIGLFPEQKPNWEWMEKIIKKQKTPISVLNLFAYTGGATLACAKAGAEVCHVDGSKSAVVWARENAELSGLAEKPIRWIIDDVILFLKREVKRGRKYDCLIMDPPSFGHGPKDELWKIEEHFLELMKLCKEVLSDTPIFVLINGYTAGYSAIVYQNNLIDLMKGHEGIIEIGELALEETKSKRLLPAGIFARWSKV
jgi:23S rRNA (cytosine1962-C5)-methyltransferase